MSIKMWYYKHFDRDKLLEELSKPVEGDYVVIHDSSTMLSVVRKDQLEDYVKYAKQRAIELEKEYINLTDPKHK